MLNKLNPRDSFQSDKFRADRHNETCLNPEFRAACETAFAAYVLTTSGSDPRVCALVEGARGVLDTLLNLGLPSVPIVQPTTQNLRPV